MGSSAFIVNHRVAMPGSVAHGAVSGSRLLYISNRPGAVCEPTTDDLRIKSENELMEKLGYIAFRPGAAAGLGAGHALFDQTGVPDRAAVAHELSETDSAIITSVVSVRAENAEAFGLATRQGWERLLRARWADTVARMGIMERKDVAWCAAVHFHPKGTNVHAHVFTWDRSGRFEGLLPKRKMVEADESLASFALRPFKDELDLARTQARDELAARLRSVELPEERVRALVAALPAEGSLKYASLAKGAPLAAEAADRCAKAVIEEDPALQKALDAWRGAVLDRARLKSLSGASLDAYVSAAESDLRVRLGNAVISNVKPRLQQLGRVPSPQPGQEGAPSVRAVPVGQEPSPTSHLEAASYAPFPTLRDEARERSLLEESSGFLRHEGMVRLRGALSAGEDPDAALLKAIPSVRIAAERTHAPAGVLSASVGSAARGVRAVANAALGGGRPDAGDEIGQAAMRLIARSLRIGLASLRTYAGKSLSEKNTAALKATERMVH